MNQFVILLYNRDHPIVEILEELQEWTLVNAESEIFQLDSDIFQKEDQKIIFYTHDTATALKIVDFCKENQINPFGVNIIPSVNGLALKREVGDNPFESRFVHCNSTTVAHMIELNAHNHFQPRKDPCAV